MRKVICYEGQENFGQLLEVGSVQLPENEKIPLTGDAMKHSPVLGTAGDFERDEETGRITAELEVVDHDARVLLENKDVGVTIYLSEVKWRKEGGSTIVTSGRLREVFISADLPWKDEM